MSIPLIFNQTYNLPKITLHTFLKGAGIKIHQTTKIKLLMGFDMLLLMHLKFNIKIFPNFTKMLGNVEIYCFWER